MTSYRGPTFWSQACHFRELGHGMVGEGGANSLRTQEKSGSLQGQGLAPETIPLGYLGYPWGAQDP